MMCLRTGERAVPAARYLHENSIINNEDSIITILPRIVFFRIFVVFFRQIQKNDENQESGVRNQPNQESGVLGSMIRNPEPFLLTPDS
jgi:hypothetical protein